jgi:hypothetical protein
VVKPRLPETLPEFGAIEEDFSGLQPVGDAWEDVYAQMWKSFKARDYGRAVDLGERFIEHHSTHAAAKLFVEECRTLLAAQLARQLDPLERIVRPCASLDSMRTARIDARTAFLLSQVDGRTTRDDLGDLAPMPRAEALRILAAALDDGLIVFDDSTK